ncbi:helix-turn-helix domain-containing protein [Halocatena halophila]|uniref:helix-turn-helix domain-containing protein n=1 Tax=Halocatena halophila TaxID=2814576 RepID=UPI002ED273E2
MRYFDFTLTAENGTIHPVDTVIADHPDVTREALLHINALGDGTGVMLYRLRGDESSFQSDLVTFSDVIAHDVLDVRGDVFHLYVHVKPGEPAGKLMALAQKYALIIDTPLAFTDRGSLRVTVVGTHDMLRRALEDLPEEISISVEQVGQYSPERPYLLGLLTERQAEVFQKAVRMGYYEIPRETTHEEIATELDCAPSTIDEHLRKAESRVLSTLVN